MMHDERGKKEKNGRRGILIVLGENLCFCVKVGEGLINWKIYVSFRVFKLKIKVLVSKTLRVLVRLVGYK